MVRHTPLSVNKTMAKQKTGLSTRVEDRETALRNVRGNRTRGSKYDALIAEAKKLNDDQALVVEGLKYAEVTVLRTKVRSLIGNGFDVSAVKADLESGTFKAVVYKKGDSEDEGEE